VRRERGLATLLAIAGEAAAGKGRVLLVEGPAGIGKSRLLEELRAHAQDSGTLALTARGGELEREFPFGVVRQLLEGTVGGPRAQVALMLGGAQRRGEQDGLVLQPAREVAQEAQRRGVAPVPGPAARRRRARELPRPCGPPAGRRSGPGLHRGMPARHGGNPLLLGQLLAALGAERGLPDAEYVGVVRQIGPRAVSRGVLLRLA